MSAFVRAVRRHLSYATVVSSLTAFVLLAGGAAYAANQLAKNSVGTKQLKKNSVTAKKIKKNAVTAAKIKKAAVNGAKVKDGSLPGSAFMTAGSAFSHIVHSTSGSGPVATADLGTVPLAAPGYTQLAGEDDFFYGSVDVAFAPGCEAPREVSFYLFLDLVDPAKPELDQIVAGGQVEDADGSAPNQSTTLGPFQGNGVRFQRDSDSPHTLTLLTSGDCNSGSGISSNASVYVVGVR
jgi:hypothetical protein